MNGLKGWAKAQRMRRRKRNWSKEYQAAHDEACREFRRKIAAGLEKRHGVQQ